MSDSPPGHVQRQRSRLHLVAEARERFLTSQELAPDVVREPILASWWRSRQLNVEADHIEMNFVHDRDPDTPLLTCAAPILRQLGDQLLADPVSIILTDAQGVVLERIDSDDAIAHYLDRVNLAPGFSYAERFVGTNGIGTALAERVPTLVEGHEHYAEDLERLVCAGVPIRHPVKGTLLGALDLTSWSGESNSLMMALAVSTAERIEKSLLTRTGLHELTLFREYLRTCQHTDGVVLALNGELVMMNETARRLLSAADQHAILMRSADVLGQRKPATVIVDLPTGAIARMRYRPVFSDRGLSGGVFDVQLSQSPAGRALEPTTVKAPRDVTSLPGLAGTSAIWQRCSREVEACYLRGEWLVLTGELGTGKLSLLRAVHQYRDPAGHFRVFDAADADAALPPENAEDWLDALTSELAAADGALVITHVDRLDTATLSGLGELLQHYDDHSGAGSSWVAVTMSSEDHHTDLDAYLLPHFPHTVEVPALRHHSEDVPELVPVLLNSVSRDHHLSFSFDAMQQLTRSPWPGNIAQLRRILSDVVHRHRTGLITAADLPPETRSAIRRRLTQLELLERDAIVRSLNINKGSKAKACAELGMSRATIYRKIRDYGITGL